MLLFAALAMFSCGDDYDDTELRNDMNDLKSRVEKLETWCGTVNSQISALQGLVSALEANDYVTGVTPVMEGAVEVGYTINFSKSGSITIKHGKDGADGSTPVIGVKKDGDGLYYWTVQVGDGEAKWLTDVAGNKIRTTGDKGDKGDKGDSGAQGHTPVLSVGEFEGKLYWKVDGEWLLDGTEKVPATGDKGDKGDKGDTGAQGPTGATGAQGDAIFAKDGVTVNDDHVIFTLKDGSTITLPLLTSTVRFESYDTFVLQTSDATDIALKLPATLKKSQYAALKAEISSVGGTDIDITTRSSVQPWTVKLTQPTFDATTGILATQPKVSVTAAADATDGDKALLKVTFVDTAGNESSSTRVLVYDTSILVTGVTLNKTTLDLKVGKDETLTATIAPANATDKTVTWESSDATVATVDANGKVTGLKAGTATITVTTASGSFTATCAVTVSNIAVTGVTLPSTSTVSISKTVTLSATIVPADATNKTVTWTSSNTAVATVNQTTGEVTGVAVGETTITATSTEYTSIAGTCKVTVTAQPSIIWAKGNLVADGANGAKIGAPDDGGLYFQFGSLIGWAGGASGDGTGVPASDSPGYEFNASSTVVPSGKSIPATWGDPDRWTGDTGTVPAEYDPCIHYLGSGWRLPTASEYRTLFNNISDSWANSGGWSWTASPASATHTDGKKFPASGYRYYSDGNLNRVGIAGYCWSASLNHDNGFNLSFSSPQVRPDASNPRTCGYPVRCVKASN